MGKRRTFFRVLSEDYVRHKGQQYIFDQPNLPFKQKLAIENSNTAGVWYLYLLAPFSFSLQEKNPTIPTGNQFSNAKC